MPLAWWRGHCHLRRASCLASCLFLVQCWASERTSGATEPQGETSEIWRKATRECMVRRKLRETMDLCGELGFSATRFANPCAPTCNATKLDPREWQDEFPVNMAFPGLTVLNSEFGVFQVDDFVAAEHLRAPFGYPRDDLPSKTPGNREMWWTGAGPDWLTVIAGFASREECRAAEKFLRSRGVHKFAYESGIRTSFEVERKHEFWADAAEAIHKQIDLLLPEFPRAMREGILASRYALGGYYTPHWDFRRCTVIIYANEGGEGGATYFPVLDLRVERRAGRAVVFFPMTASGFNKVTLLHAAEEQLSGEKRVLQIFIDPATQEKRGKF